jgi:hypothetical protein
MAKKRPINGEINPGNTIRESDLFPLLCSRKEDYGSQSQRTGSWNIKGNNQTGKHEHKRISETSLI